MWPEKIVCCSRNSYQDNAKEVLCTSLFYSPLSPKSITVLHAKQTRNDFAAAYQKNNFLSLWSLFKIFSWHIRLSKTLGWKLWLDISFHNTNQIKFPCTESWNGPQMSYVYFQFSSPRSEELIALWVNWPKGNYFPDFSEKNLLLFSRLPEGNLPQTQEKNVIFFVQKCF